MRSRGGGGGDPERREQVPPPRGDAFARGGGGDPERREQVRVMLHSRNQLVICNTVERELVVAGSFRSVDCESECQSDPVHIVIHRQERVGRD